MTEIINGMEHDWVIHETLMQHKNMLHATPLIIRKKTKKQNEN